MIFEVIRTSDISGKKIPYEKCIRIKLKLVDRRNFLTPELYDRCKASNCKKWFDEGENHRIEDGCILRDIGEKETWGMEINALEELLNFINETGEEVIISKSYIDYRTPCLEIYDDYRE